MTFKEYILEDEKVKHHFNRLDMHVGLVQKYGKMIIKNNYNGVDNRELKEELDKHDLSKRSEPELTPYVDISWYYKLKKDGKEMPMTSKLEKAMNEATFHHIKNNKHHADYWSEEVSIEGSMKTRDSVSKNAIDCTSMPLTHVAHMVADWLAMSEEVGGTTKQWADDNINKRWEFNKEQISLIYKIIGDIK